MGRPCLGGDIISCKYRLQALLQKHLTDCCVRQRGDGNKAHHLTHGSSIKGKKDHRII